MPGPAHARPSPGSPHLSPQALGLRSQPGQRGCGKGVAVRPPPVPRPRGQFRGHRPRPPPAGQPRESAFCFLEPSDTAPHGRRRRAHATLPWGELPRWGSCAQPGPGLDPARLPLFPLLAPFSSVSLLAAVSSCPPPFHHLWPPTGRLRRNLGTPGHWAVPSPEQDWQALSGCGGAPKPKSSGVGGRVGQAFLGRGGGGARVFLLRV